MSMSSATYTRTSSQPCPRLTRPGVCEERNHCPRRLRQSLPHGTTASVRLPARTKKSGRAGERSSTGSLERDIGRPAKADRSPWRQSSSAAQLGASRASRLGLPQQNLNRAGRGPSATLGHSKHIARDSRWERPARPVVLILLDEQQMQVRQARVKQRQRCSRS